MTIIKILSRIFIILISLFYGVVFSGQVLGLLKLYNLPFALILSLAISGLVFYALATNLHWLDNVVSESKSSSPNFLNIALLVSALGLFGLLVFAPLTRWPFSPISTKLTWDAGLYHFPKAIEMLVTASAWDMTIDYGEYPFGYESLLALAFGTNPDGYLLGFVHALIGFYFFLSFWLVARRFTKLPNELLLFFAVIMILSRLYLPQNDNNIWWVIWTQIILIGKNDLLLGAILLSVILFTPSPQQKVEPNHLFGLAISSMLALSVKPNSLLLVLCSWCVLAYSLVRSQGWRVTIQKVSLQALIVLPGLLWAFRNLIAMGDLFKPNAAKLSRLSIAANLGNPYFYEYIPTQMYIVLAIILLSIFIAFFKKENILPMLLGLALFSSFILTPASAFLGNNQHPTQIAWRFAVGLLAYQAILLLIPLAPLIDKIYRWVINQRIASILAAFVVLLFSLASVYLHRELFETNTRGDLVLRDQFKESVGVNGYWSAYEYVQQNVHNATVIVENGLPYYLYDDKFTNSVTRSHDADYFVAFKTAWNSGEKEEFPEMILTSEWEETWQLVYEDSQGRVFQRKP